jgi:hypothetical protein
MGIYIQYQSDSYFEGIFSIISIKLPVLSLIRNANSIK